jgi:hypothetical protein
VAICAGCSAHGSYSPCDALPFCGCCLSSVNEIQNTIVLTSNVFKEQIYNIVIALARLSQTPIFIHERK